MKKSLILAGMLSIGYVYSQEGRVGINTDVPSATLNVKSKTGTTSATKNFELQNADDTKLVTVLDNGNVGIGIDNPQYNLHIEPLKGDGMVNLALRSYGSTTNKSWTSNYFRMERARGKRGAEEVVQSGDEIGRISFSAYDGEDYRASNSLTLRQKGEIKNGIVPMRWEFAMPSHLNGSLWNKPFVIDHTGYIGVNMWDHTPQAPLHVGGSPLITDFTDEEKENYKKSIVLIELHNWASLNPRQHPITQETRSSIASSMYGFKPKFRAHSIDFGLIDLEKTTNPFMAFSIAPRLGSPTDKDETIERMRISSNGNVGIATTAPTHRLHIVADADPLKLEGLQEGTGSTLVVDVNGVIKKGNATSNNGVQNQSGMKCDATNAGKINYTTKTINDEEKGIFGFCMQKGTEYVWGYMLGGGNLYGTSADGAAFGDGL